MKNKVLQKGILFNNYPALVFFATELFSSNADMFLKTARFITKDNSLTSDLQIFRDIRADEPDLNKIKELYSSNISIESIQTEIDKFNIAPNEIGGWYVLLCQLIGYRESIKKSDNTDETLEYVNFLENHCLLERSFFSEVSQMPNLNQAWVNEKVSSWLLIDKVDLLDGPEEGKIEYFISLILYWTALYEVLMHIEWQDENYSRMLLLKSLPILDKNQKLCRSNEVLLEKFKIKRAKFKGIKKLKWTELSAEIASARVDNGLSVSASSYNDYLPEEANIQVLKRLLRWRKGYTKNGTKSISFITIDDFKQYLAILDHRYDKDDMCISSGTIIFLQLWELIQFECQKLNVSDKFIVDTFSKYPEYLALVKRRFHSFKSTGKLNP
jgi:hypothetical protein